MKTIAHTMAAIKTQSLSRRNMLSLFTLGTAAAVAGCVNGATITVSTTTLQTYAQAADKLIENIINATGFMSLLSTADQTSITAIEAKISAIIASISAAGSQTISIDTGKTWAKSLISELQQLLSIAQPIAAQYNTQIASYLGLANNLITLIETAVGLVTTAVSAEAPVDSATTISNIYRGIGA